MKHNYISITCIIFFVSIVLFSCASQGTPEDIALPKNGGAISFPPGWNDSIIEKIKAGQSTKNILAVLDFEGNEKLKGKVDLKMSDMLTTSLVKTGRFDIVERNKIDNIIKEQRLGLAGIIDEMSAAEVGKMIGAEYVVFGSITSATRSDIDKFGYILVKIEVGIDVRVVNATTGKILLSESAIGLSESKIVQTADGVVVSGAIDYNSAYAKSSRDAVNKVSSKIANLLPLIGFVVSTNIEEIIVDVGEDRGVKRNDRFVVFRVGEEILHPVTGNHIGWKKEILQEISITTTEKSMATGITMRKKSESEVMPGDLVISR
ncbi:MAG: CsgG/HfaB family protein [Candidatus Marinimicrobia bacterium]|nr:CsgG/HfaB family protein [Candidatus Neomarinimicrobiota bacterium]